MKKIRLLLPHILLILSGIFMTFLVLDRYNPTMDFVGNEISTILFWGFCILTVIQSSLIIASNRKNDRETLHKNKKSYNENELMNKYK